MLFKPVNVPSGTWFQAHDFANLYPVTDGPKMFAIADAMKENGFCDRFRIVLIRDEEKGLLVLDGRTRQMAAKRATVEPLYLEFCGNRAEALTFVQTANRHRRHQDDESLALVDNKTFNERALLAGQAATRNPGRFTEGESKSLQEAAEEQGISRRTAVDGKAVVERGTQALKDAVLSGDISVSDAAKIVNQPPEVQDQAVKDVQTGDAKKVTEAVNTYKKRTQNGAVAFDDKDLNALIGKVTRKVDERAKLYPSRPRRDRCIEILSDLIVEIDAWRKE